MITFSVEYNKWSAEEVLRAGLYSQSLPYLSRGIGICTEVWLDPYIMLSMGQLSWGTAE